MMCIMANRTAILIAQLIQARKELRTYTHLRDHAALLESIDLEIKDLEKRMEIEFDMERRHLNDIKRQVEVSKGTR